MFSHIMLGTNDYLKAQKFYDAILGVVGAAPGTVNHERQRVMYNHNGGLLVIGKPINGEPATFANGGTFGFVLESEAAVDAWHAAGLANGGSACEDPPGLRATGSYLAYLRDPDGNKLCGLMRPRA